MATETLRPSAAGDECNIHSETGASCPNHYQNVDEASPDDDTTLVADNYNYLTYFRDLYNIADSGVGAGTINSVKVYARCKGEGSINQASLKIAVKSGGTVDESVAKTVTESWASYDNTWATNPDDSQPWEWADIDALQVGIALRDCYSSARAGKYTYCTQVYVEVDYTPAGAGIGAHYLKSNPLGVNIISAGGR